jgi:Ca2+-dependent lipid-binding protein
MSTSQSASELKVQGAAEAAQDPNNPVSAEQAEQAMLQEARKAGMPAMRFDPNASPEEKAAQARSQVPPGFHRDKKSMGTALASDMGGKGPKLDLPPASKADILPAGAVEEEDEKSPTDDPSRWSRVGWAPRFGNGEDEDDDTTMLDHQTFLEGKLDDKWFGGKPKRRRERIWSRNCMLTARTDWYHNTGVIIFACLTSWTVAVLGGGLGWVMIIMAFCGTYYRTSIRRVRRNVRDDVNRQLQKTRLETDSESLEWINSFLVKFWPIYAPVLSQTIVQSVDQVLSNSVPSFLDALSLKEFVLGTKPPRVEFVKTYPKTDDDVVLMDWKFSFTPNDIADLTARQIKNKLNPRIVLEVRVGKGVVSKGLDVIVEDMSFVGTMRVKFKLQLPFPHIERVEVCFLGRPEIDYVCKPLGGDTFGFDINFIPGLESFIQEMIHSSLAPMMYDPNVFPIEIAKMLAGDPVDQAIGVLQVTFHGAQGLKNPDKFAGTPDPYAVLSIENKNELGRTKTISENANPRWNETMNVIVSSLKESLTMTVYDYNEYRKDKELGIATFPMDQLEQNNELENVQLEVMANGRQRGVIQADIRFFPVLEGRKLEGGVEEPPPESNTGIAKFSIDMVKKLDGSKSIVGQLSPYAIMTLNDHEVHRTKTLRRTNQPIWPDASKELLITDRKKAKLGFKIKDDRDLSADPTVASYSIKLDDMLDAMAKGRQWHNLHEDKEGIAKLTLQWKPVALRGALGGSGGYIKPIGVVRLHFKNARDLKNLEAMGKSDPYVRVLLSGIEKGRTVTFKNNLNPDWDEVIYVPVHTPSREKILIEVMDAENMGKDRPLGHIELSVSDLAQQEDNGAEWLVNNDKTLRSEKLRLGPRSGPKGTLNYTASFYPVENVRDPEEEEEDERRSLERTSLEMGGRASLDSTQTGTDTSIKRRSAANGTISSLRTNDTVPTSPTSLTSPTSPISPTSATTGASEEAYHELPMIEVTPENVQQYGKLMRQSTRLELTLITRQNLAS